MDPYNETTRRPAPTHILVLLVALVTILPLSIYVYQVIQQRGKHAVVVHSVPDDAKVFVDDKKVRPSTLQLKPGKYSVRIERDGFEPQTQDLEVANSNQESLQVFFALTPATSEARKWAENHTDEYLALEHKAAENRSNQHLDVASSHPVALRLPHRSSFYSIDYDVSGGDFKILIDAKTPLGRQVAVERLKSWGYEPSDYVIEFLHFASPFAQQGRD